MKVTAVPYAFAAASAQSLKVTNGANSTTLSVTNPTTVNTILVPDASGTVAVSASGNIALSAAGNITLTGQIPIANGGTNANTSQGAINNISQLTTEGDLLYFNGTNSTRFARGANGECLKSSTTSIIWGSCGAASGTLQSAYNAGGVGDQVIQLSSANDSIIIRNPASSGTDSGYTFVIDQLAGGAVGGLDIQSAGTGNLLRIRDTTATAQDVLVVADGGAVTLRNQTDSTSALRVLTQSGTNFFNVDTTNQTLSLRNKTDDATIGAELFTGSYSFPATAGWSAVSGSGSSATATHNSGNTNTLYATPSFTPVAGATYQISFDTSGNPPLGEHVAVAIGSSLGPEVYGNQTGATQVLTATTTDQLQFSPTNDWTGTISNISIKRITRSNPTLQVLDSTGASQFELRVGGAADSRSTFIGQYSGQANTSTGYFNTGFGSWTLSGNTTGSYNTAVGNAALTYNTLGSSNAAFGESALYSNTSGSNNTGFGTSSLFSNTTGSNNVAVGSYSLSSVTVGSNNTALGTSAGEYDNNQSQFASLNNLQGSTMLGAYSQAFANNVLALGGQGTNSVKVGIGTGLPTNQLSAEAYRYSTGTVDTNGTTTVTGSGTTFTSDMVGNVIYIASGDNTVAPYVRTITGYTNATTITVNSNVPTLSGAEYYINYVGLQVKTDGDTQLGGNLLANSTATGTTGTTEATARTNVTTVTLTAAGAFANNDIIFINNAGQDYYTRIVSGGGTTTLTVSPAVSYDASATVTKYTAQNIGATTTDYTSLNNRFFQGYFLGGVVTGAGSTTLSDGNIMSTNNLRVQTATGVNIQNTTNSSTALQVSNSDGSSLLTVDTNNRRVVLHTDDVTSQIGWSTGTAGGTARQGHKSVVVGDKMYVYSGANSGGTRINTIDIYNFTTNTWSTGMAGGTARSDFSMVAYNNKLYALGGYNGSTTVSTMDVYDIAANTWSVGVPLGNIIAQQTAVVYGTKMYVWGGCNTASCINQVNTMNIYDFTDNTWSTGTAGGTARRVHSAALYGTKIYFYGGLGMGNGVDIYDIVGDTWSTGTAGGTARYYHTGATYGNSMYIWGGTAGGNSMDVYNYDTNTWSSGTAGGTARQYTNSVISGSKIYIWGGNTGSTVNTMDIYDFGSTYISPTLLALANAATDPNSATNGAMYYNTSSNTLRCFDSVIGGWSNCNGNLSGSYILNGTSQQIGNFNIKSANAASVTTTIQGTASQSANILEVKADSVANPLLSIGATGATTFRNIANFTSAFQIQNSSGVSLFTADTTNGNLQVGSSTTDATANLFVLDSYNNGTDPTGVNGAQYYNTNLNKFRCYENGAWKDCEQGITVQGNSVDTIKREKLNFVGSGVTVTDKVVATDDYPNDVLADNPLGYWRFESGALTTDSSGNGRTLTSNGTPTETAPVMASGGAVDLGSGDYYSRNDTALINLTNYTVEVWFKPAGPSVGTTGQIIGSSWSSGQRIPYAITQNGSQIQFAYFDGSTWRYIYQFNQTVGTAYHLVFVNNNGQYTAYVNGVQMGTYAGTAAGSTASSLFIGKRWDNSDYANGVVDEAAIFSTVLSEPDIAARHTLGLTATGGYYTEINISDGSLQSAYNISPGGVTPEILLDTTRGGLDIKAAISTNSAFRVFNNNDVSVMNVNTLNGSLELGSYNAGTNPVTGNLVLANNVNSYKNIIQGSAVTADRIYNLPDRSGTLIVNPTDAGTQSFNYISSTDPQEFIVPAGVTELNITLRGASGGDSHGYPGGTGAIINGDIPVTPGETLYIYVGGRGSRSTPYSGGFNGGGASFAGAIEGWNGGGGGGATDIRRGGISLTDRIVVAGGGGGSAKQGSGGNGGDPNGYNGAHASRGGKGGTQVAGGAGGCCDYGGSTAASPGSLGLGGNASNGSIPGGGGGGGYYGGGGGAGGGTVYDGGGGGGGSSLLPSGFNATPGSVGDGSVIVSWVAGSGTKSYLPVFDNNNAIVDSQISQSGTSVKVHIGLDVMGDTKLQPAVNSTTAFQIQNSSGVSLFTADTTNGNLQVGSSTTDATANLFVLDSYNNGTDPTGVNGAQYYNTNLNKFRCYENGAWADCIGAGGGGGSYVQFANASLQEDATTNSSIFINKTGVSGNIMQLQSGGIDILSLDNTGVLTLQNTIDSSAALSVKDAAGETFFNIDSANRQLNLNNKIDNAVFGSDIFGADNNTCSGTNWTDTGINSWSHTAGSSDELVCSDPSITAGSTYEVTYSTASTGSVSFIIRLGDAYGRDIYGDIAGDSQVITALNTNSFHIAAHPQQTGSITITSVKPIITSSSSLVIKDSGNTTALEVRAANTSIGIGLNSLQANDVNGNYNVALGNYSLQSNTIGWGNTANGHESLLSNTTGNFNTAYGYQSLLSNVTGLNNTSIGADSLAFNYSGQDNTAIGYQSLSNNATGTGNTANGANSLQYNNGSYNTALGYNAGAQGTQSQFMTSSELQGSTAVGAYAQVYANNVLALGGQGADAIKVGIGTGAPTGTLSVEPFQYNTGTVTTAADSGSVTGSGTTFTAAMVGSKIYIASNSNTVAPYSGAITAFNSATDITVSPVVPAANAGSGQSYYINYVGLQVKTDGDTQLGGHLLAGNNFTAITGTTEPVARTNVTDITLTTDAFDVNDVILFDNAGQDYYARIRVDNADGTYTVSPAVSYDASITVTKYNIQNIGATDTDYTTQSNRFFQGYFLGGIVAGTGSTTLSDGNLTSTNGLKLQSATGTTIQSTADSSEAFQVKDSAGLTALSYDTSSHLLMVGGSNGVTAGVGQPASWQERVVPAANNWNSVAYGNGLFVAVSSSGAGNRVMTSSDGINWTSRTSAADNSWYSVTYGNGLFVAVSYSGAGNRVMTSPDGINWTSRTSAADNSWYSVTYGNGMFVAVSCSGTGNRVMTSPDGISWTSRNSADDICWESVTYGNGKFVAVADEGVTDSVMTSPDGINWTLRTAASDHWWNSVTYGNGKFVAVAYDGSGTDVMTSPDGITWTAQTAPANGWASVTYGNGLFMAVSWDETGRDAMSSPDGITWTDYATPNTGPYWISVAYGNGQYVASASGSGAGGRIMTSAKIEANMYVQGNQVSTGNVSIYGPKTTIASTNTNAFSVQDAAANNIFNVNTVNNTLAIGYDSRGKLFEKQADTYSVGWQANSVESADFNNDGNQDLATSNLSDGTVSVLMGNGDGTFEAAVDYGTANTPSSIATSDFDKDGDIDMAVTNESSSSVSILMNNGDGTFAAKVDYGTNSGPADIATADFDKDGDFDVVTANSGTNNVSILMNNGDGTFATKVDYTTLSYPQALTVNDFDGDGDLEFAVTYTSAYYFSIFSNNGNGTFATKVDNSATRNVIASSDFNGDGQIDVAVAASTTTSSLISIYTKNGSIYSYASYAVSTQPSSITPVDVNKDGKIDILATSRNTGKVSVLINNGDGTFAEKDDYYVATSPYDMAVADFDKDGDIDMAVLDESAEAIVVLKNKSLNVSAAETPAVAIQVSGYTDSLQINSTGGKSNLRVDAKGNMTIGGTAANGSFGLFSKGDDFTVPSGSQEMTVVDVSADKKLDLIITNYNSDTAIVYIRQSNNELINSGEYITGDRPAKIATADFNKDNKLDFAVTNSNDNTVSVFLGMGNGSFGAGVTYATGAYPYGIIATDLNKDGVADLAVINSDDSSFSAIINNGNGTFATHMDYPVADYGYPYEDIAAADFDKDGDIDVVVANGDLDSVSVFKNNGNGTFAAKTDYFVGNYPYGMVVYDYDKNGTIDILVGSDNYMSVLYNDGTGDFPTKQDIGCDYNCQVSNISDINNDGYEDVIMNSAISYMLNNRAGGLNAITEYDEYNSDYRLFVGDIDDDGDKDIMSLGYGKVETALNNTISNSRFKIMNNAGTASLLNIDQNGSMQVQTTSDVEKAFTVTNSAGSDVFSVSSQNGSLSVGSGPATGTMYYSEPTATTGMAAIFWPGFASADFNHDGDADIATVRNVSSVYKLTISNNNGNGTFTQGSQITAEYSSDIKVADINNDSYADVVMAGTNNVITSINNKDGTFTSIANYAKASTDTYRVNLVVADLNGDGWLDIAINNPTPKTYSVYINNGNGTFAAKVDYSLTKATDNIISGDFDNDGDIDLAFSTTNYTIMTAANNGNGTFAAYVEKSLGRSVYGMVATDYDRDGDKDILVATSWGGYQLMVFVNNGSGTFANAQNLDPGVGTFVTLLDANHDGYEDFVTACGQLYANNKKGNYYLLESYAIGTCDGYTPAAIADINVDSKLDILFENAKYVADKQLGVAAAAASPTLLVSDDGFHDSFLIKGQNETARLKINTNGDMSIGGTTGTGTGMFTKSAEYPTNGFGAMQISKADLNKDGNLDIVTSDNAVFYANSKGGLTGPSAIETNDGEDLLTTDIDNDGDSDVVTSYKSCGLCDGYVGVIKNNNDGTFASRVSYNVGPGNYFLKRYLMKVDYNRDGYTDLIFSDETITKIMLNDGTGAFTSITDVAITDVRAAADYDRDGDIDLIAFPQNPDSPYDITFKLYSNSSGTFTETKSFGFVGEFAGSYDINNDGYEDILTGSSALNAFYNVGGDIKASVNLLSSTGVMSIWDKHPIDFIDIDNDGDIDMVGDGVVVINESGKYVAYAMTIPGSTEVKSPLAIDIDRDGDLDIVLSDESNDKIVIMKNNAIDNTRFGIYDAAGTNKLLSVSQGGSLAVQTATNDTNAFQVQNAIGTTLLGADTTNMKLTVGGSIVSSNSATSTTGTTENNPQTNVTTVTLIAAGAFVNNDVIFIDNAGQDYFTRIVSGGGTTTLTVSPAISYDASATVTKYTVQNIGATNTDYSSLSSRFYQGYFLGGIVTGAGSTIYSDGSIMGTHGLSINTADGVVIKSPSDNYGTFQVQQSDGTVVFSVDSASMEVVVRNIVVDGQISIHGHLLAYDSATPSGDNTGTVCSGTNVSINGSDVAGNIEIDTGTGCSAGKIAGIVFGAAYEWQSEVQVTLTPANSATADLNYYVDSSYDGGFEVKTTNTPTDSTTYKFYYHVIAGTQPINPN